MVNEEYKTKRQETIQKVVESIIKKQKKFFANHGKSKPMVLKDVALILICMNLLA